MHILQASIFAVRATHILMTCHSTSLTCTFIVNVVKSLFLAKTLLFPTILVMLFRRPLKAKVKDYIQKEKNSLLSRFKVVIPFFVYN
jgi:hypothetical protein